ncbi:sensory transduction histidine kinase [Pyrenophora seminiperda CCB06]|uniref:Sensory transduction histidine kinase n=1 Tax=Pyrenophora seminiperda CCB06 TaxID=1302712 RepID=A0A3M7LZ61_9PLEO|nr:sensory transduction histidine kinase [Pyrenophora seminiperda CCB06]
MVLSNTAPAVLFWGEQLIMLYNEPYIRLLGHLHPCMGKSIRTEAPEHWISFEPIINHIKATGEPLAESDMLLFIDKDGFLEETHWCFQFVPISDRHGCVTAYYQSFIELTSHRLLERRVSSLVAMGTLSADARDFPSFWNTTLRSLSLNDKDVPFALLYAAERHVSAEMPSMTLAGNMPPLDGCVLKGTIGVAANHPIAPTNININDGSYVLHPAVLRAAHSGKAMVVNLDDLPEPSKILEGIEWRGYGDPCRILIICPIIPTSGNQVEGFLIIGVNPRRPFDEDYQQYLHVMVRLLATSLASIVLFEDEVRQREKDIIQAKQIQDQLRAEIQLRENKFQRFAERADVAIFVTDPSGSYTYRNQRWYDIFEVASADTNATEAWYKIAFEEDLSFCESVFSKLVTEHESVCFELRTRMPFAPPLDDCEQEPDDTQHFRWILCSAYPELSSDDELIEIVGNVTDISKQKWAEGIQRLRTDSALQGKQHLEHFIDTTSHEMRNPLSAIMQCADSITSSFGHDGRLSPAIGGMAGFLTSTLDAAQTISQCAQHMRHIVDDILTISKLDSGLLDMTPVIAQPENVARHAVKMFDAEARAAGIELSLVVGQSYRDLDVDWTSLDPTRVLQILINLLTNAIKFTRLEHTKLVKVTLTASTAEPVSVPGGIQYNDERLVGNDHHLEEDWKSGEELIYLHFSVSDTGRGLSEEEKGTLFTRFSQASPRTHIHYGGSGLGLFISRRLTELQGGAIGVASEKGKGSTFAFYIKSRRAHTTASRKGSLPHVFPEDVKHRPQIPQPGRSRPTQLQRAYTSEFDRRSNSPRSSLRRQSSDSNSMPTLIEHTHVNPESLGLPEGPDLQELKRTQSIPETLHVLIVEDNLVNQRVLSKQLHNLGCIVSVANHGREALDFLPRTTFWNHSHPLSDGRARTDSLSTPFTEPICTDQDEEPPVALSLILMDWEMPIMNGLTAVSEIRKLEDEGLLKGRIPVIGVTANVRKEQIDMAMTAGMDDVVGKPFRVAELLLRMKDVIASMEYDGGAKKSPGMGGYTSYG